MNKAVEIPPEEAGCVCVVQTELMWGTDESMFRMPGTLWQCPECLTWWASRWFTTPGTYVTWDRVRKNSDEWKRIEAHGRTRCLHERTHNSGFLGLGRAQRCLDCGEDLR